MSIPTDSEYSVEYEKKDNLSNLCISTKNLADKFKKINNILQE